MIKTINEKTDTNFDEIFDKKNNLNSEIKQAGLNISNLTTLQETIKNRILTQFKNVAQKNKLTFWAKYSLPTSLVCFGFYVFTFGLSILLIFNNQTPSTLLFSSSVLFPLFYFSICSFVLGISCLGSNIFRNKPSYFPGLSLKKYFKGYFNFETESNNYFDSFDSIFNTNEDIMEHMFDKSDNFFSKNIYKKDLENILQLNNEEIEALNNSNLNVVQKELLKNKINKDKILNFSNLQELIEFSEIEPFKTFSIKEKFKQAL